MRAEEASGWEFGRVDCAAWYRMFASKVLVFHLIMQYYVQLSVPGKRWRQVARHVMID
jgi:hypothetical protein